MFTAGVGTVVISFFLRMPALSGESCLAASAVELVNLDWYMLLDSAKINSTHRSDSRIRQQQLRGFLMLNAAIVSFDATDKNDCA